MHHPNEKVLREADEAQLRGDIDAFLGFFTDDVIAHIPGSSSLAGDYAGKEAFGHAFQKFSELVPDYTFEPHAYLADDEHGMILQKSHYRRGEESLDTDEAFVCHFRDGKIAEFWLLSVEEDAVDRFIG